MSVENNEAIENEEANLDKEIEASVEKVRAGEGLAPAPKSDDGATGPTGATGGEGEGDGPTGPTGATGASDDGSAPNAEQKGDDSEFRVPNKGKFESDESYEKRVELFDLVKRRKAATTPEAKAALTEEIKKTKGDLRILNQGNGQINSKPVEKKDGEEEDPALAADKARLKELGGMTKEDVDAYLQQQQAAIETKSTLEKFVEKYAELKDPDVREVFFDFVDANYVWQGKTGKDLVTTLELAREAMFRPQETVQERVLKGAGVQEKVNAMNFPGGTSAGGNMAGLSPEQRKSVEEMKAAGLSEEKALELIS